MYGLLFLLLLTFHIFPRATYPDFFFSLCIELEACGFHFTPKEAFACLKHSFFTSHCVDEKILPLPTALVCMPPREKKCKL